MFSSVSEESERLRTQLREQSTELELLRANLATESARNKDVGRMEELRRKMEDISFEKKKLDHEYKDTRRRMEDDRERLDLTLLV